MTTTASTQLRQNYLDAAEASLSLMVQSGQIDEDGKADLKAMVARLAETKDDDFLAEQTQRLWKDVAAQRERLQERRVYELKVPQQRQSTETAYPATPKQVSFLTSLLRDRVAPESWDVERMQRTLADGGVSKSQASKAIDTLLQRPFREQRSERKALPDVPAGHYAVKSHTGAQDLDFFRVDRPTEGRWAGRTFVKRVIGGHPDTPIRYAELEQVLAAILEAGPDKAATLYGQELGRCSRCNRHLTDETSRALGIGPECRSK